MFGSSDPQAIADLLEESRVDFHVATKVRHAAEVFDITSRPSAIRETAFGSAHQEVAASYRGHGSRRSSHAQQKYLSAKFLYRRALDILKAAVGKDDLTLVDYYNNIAGFYEDQEDHMMAEVYYLNGLTLSENVLGSDHIRVASSLTKLAGLYGKMGKARAATFHYKQALKVYERVLGHDHPGIVPSLQRYATYLIKQGQTAEAEKLIIRVEEIRDKDDD